MFAATLLLAQTNVDVSLGDPFGVFGVLGAAVGAFLTTLVVGGVLLALAPDYTERMCDVVTEEPVESGAYGVFFLLAIAVITVVLFVTIIGILVAVPLVLLAWLTWAIGSAIAFLAVGERLVGETEDSLKPLAVGALINGGLALSGVGGLLSFAVGAAGFGAVLRDWLE